MSEVYNSEEVCRLCTVGGGLRMHIFDKEGEQRQLLYKIKSCLPIMVSNITKFKSGECDQSPLVCLGI